MPQAIQVERALQPPMRKGWDRWEPLSSLNPDHFEALHIKECILEVQAVLLRKVAADENQLRGAASGEGPLRPAFGRHAKDAAEAIESLRY